MARRKNVKRIDPRYFLHETVDRNEDGSALEEKFQGIPKGAATPELQLKAGPSRAEKEATAEKEARGGFETCEEFAEWLGEEVQRLAREDDQYHGHYADRSDFEAKFKLAQEECGITRDGSWNFRVGGAPPKPDPGPTSSWTQRSLEEAEALDEFQGIPKGAATRGKQLKARGSRADRCAALHNELARWTAEAQDEAGDPRWAGGGPAQAEFLRIQNEIEELPDCELPAAAPSEPAPVSAPKAKPRWGQRELEEE
jgi:hypothetical protein